jgi:hypothetical protein
MGRSCQWRKADPAAPLPCWQARDRWLARHVRPLVEDVGALATVGLVSGLGRDVEWRGRADGQHRG